jgi:cation diffusion facilitator CzcD-associated flavoprotein CzcO
VIQENHLNDYIHYSHKVTGCHYSSKLKSWKTDVTNTQDGTSFCVQSSFLWVCTGYYDHDTPYTPAWKGMDTFQGKIIHPQHWPISINNKDNKEGKEDTSSRRSVSSAVDLNDKKVVVIGSGATAVSLIPAIALYPPDRKYPVVMVQRSPSYMSTGFGDTMALPNELRKLGIKEEWIHEIMRRKTEDAKGFFLGLVQQNPEKYKELTLDGIRQILGEEMVTRHFTPSYRLWHQRIHLDPNGMLLNAIKDGKVLVHTAEIDHFTEKGVVLKESSSSSSESKEEKELIEADVIITSTGFNMCIMGNIPFTIDTYDNNDVNPPQTVDWSERITYRGIMFDGIPNLFYMFGYLRTGWSMRTDITAAFITRLLSFMICKGYTEVIPRYPYHLLPSAGERETSTDVSSLRPWIDESDYSTTFLKRAVQLMPKSGVVASSFEKTSEWCHSQNFLKDSEEFPKVVFDENSAFEFN